MTAVSRRRPATPVVPAAPSAPSPAQLAQQVKARSPIEVTGAQSLVLSLEAMEVDTVFGIPGGAILPAYDPLLDSVKVRHILVRHEQGAGHAAEGYASATGRVGVCMATSGPGATNLVTPLADAHMDSVPIVAITGQVSSAVDRHRRLPGGGHPRHHDADHEAQLPRDRRRRHPAGHRRGVPHRRPRAAPARCSSTSPRTRCRRAPRSPGRRASTCPATARSTRPHGKQIREAARLIAEAERPILYVGGGVIRARASEELRRFVELSRIPVVTTLMARGALPDSHPLHLGMPGMHGSVSAVTGLQKADLIIALGARFDDRVTGQLSTFAPEAKVIHADIDPAEICKNRKADVPIVGDCKRGARRPHRGRRRRHRRRPRAATTPSGASGSPAGRRRSRWATPSREGGTLAPQYVIERLSAIAGPEAVYVAGVGQHQMWAAQFVQYERPNAWLNSGGLGTMGYAVPAAMGAQVGEPDRTVWAIDGDGCFQMTNQELATCVINNIPIKVAIINNSSLGMVRQWQTLFYNERYSNTDLHTSVGSRVPDFVKLADAYGCAGLRCERPEDVDATIRAAMEVNDRPVVVDFVVHRDAMVWPMVPAGVSNDLIQVARDTAPQWDREESEAVEQAIDPDHDGIPSGSHEN